MPDDIQPAPEGTAPEVSQTELNQRQVSGTADLLKSGAGTAPSVDLEAAREAVRAWELNGDTPEMRAFFDEDLADFEAAVRNQEALRIEELVKAATAVVNARRRNDPVFEEDAIEWLDTALSTEDRS